MKANADAKALEAYLAVDLAQENLEELQEALKEAEKAERQANTRVKAYQTNLAGA